MQAKMYDQVEKLFKRCLNTVLNIDLWKTYLAYIRETKDKQQNYREKMSKAYEFALDRIGLDLQCYSIWNDYITFLRNFEVQGTFAENQRISQVRKVCPTDGSEMRCGGFSTISQFLERILMEHIDIKNSLDFRLKICCICSLRIRS